MNHSNYIINYILLQSQFLIDPSCWFCTWRPRAHQDQRAGGPALGALAPLPSSPRKTPRGRSQGVHLPCACAQGTHAWWGVCRVWKNQRPARAPEGRLGPGPRGSEKSRGAQGGQGPCGDRELDSNPASAHQMSTPAGFTAPPRAPHPTSALRTRRRMTAPSPERLEACQASRNGHRMGPHTFWNDFQSPSRLVP